jgi:hypothetical protein
MYWEAYSLFKLGKVDAALSLAENALFAFAWDESSKEKARIVALITKCGGKV